MDTVQETTHQPGTEEKAKPVTPQSTATTDKSAKSAKPAVGSSAGARTKTVESEKPLDPVNKIRRGIIWSLVGGFLATTPRPPGCYNHDTALLGDSGNTPRLPSGRKLPRGLRGAPA